MNRMEESHTRFHLSSHGSNYNGNRNQKLVKPRPGKNY